MSEDNKQNTDERAQRADMAEAYHDEPGTKSALDDRFKYLNEQEKIAQEQAILEAAKTKIVVDGINEDIRVSNQAVQADAEKERKAARNIDPYIMLKQIEAMREEGIDEGIIKEAFNQFMDERSGSFRKPLRRIIKTEDSVPTLTPEQEARHYIERVLGPQEANETVEMILRGIHKKEELAQERARNKPVAKPRLTVKMLVYRVLYFSLSKFLQLIVWSFAKLGVK